MTIRPFKKDDWPAMEEIIRLIWTMGLDYVREHLYGFKIGGKPWQERKTQSMYHEVMTRPANWFVTEEDGKVIGFCSYSLDTETGIGQVGQNGIHPNYKGKGYGSRQLNFILDLFRQKGVKIVEVHTGLNEGHAPARAMYERAGFKPFYESRLYTLKLEETA